MNKTFASVLSFVFNPLLMPTLMLAVFYWYTPEIVGMSSISVTGRFLFLLFINFYTFIMPSALIYLLYRMGMVKTLTLKDLKDRRIPYLLTIFLYLFVSYFIYSRSPMYYATAVLIFFSAVVTIIVAIISLWWQVSAHSAGMGGTVGAFFVTFTKYGNEPLYYALMLSIIVAGLVMAARLKLNAHTLAQVFTGFSVGFAVSLWGFYLL